MFVGPGDEGMRSGFQIKTTPGPHPQRRVGVFLRRYSVAKVAARVREETVQK